MTDDLRKLAKQAELLSKEGPLLHLCSAQELCQVYADSANGIRNLLDTLDRLTAESAAQRKLLEVYVDALEAITQHLQPQEGESHGL